MRGSLERLGVDHVDLYLAHDPDPDVPRPETIGAFGKPTAEGVIGAYGVSNYDAPELADALTAGDRRPPRTATHC